MPEDLPGFMTLWLPLSKWNYPFYVCLKMSTQSTQEISIEIVKEDGNVNLPYGNVRLVTHFGWGITGMAQRHS